MNIDNEFKMLIQMLTREEHNQLEKKIIKEGCRNSIVTWNDILIDGYDHYDICTNHNIPFSSVSKIFCNREDVIDWIYSNQFSKSNLTDAQRSYLRGKQYSRERKKLFDRNQHAIQSGRGNNKCTQNIAKYLAKHHKLTEKTIRLDELYAAALDSIGENIGEVIKQNILIKELNVSKKEVIQIGKLSQEKQREELLKDISLTKTCSDCGKDKPKSEFYKGRSKCKHCYCNGKEAITKDFMGIVIKSNSEANKLAKEHMEAIVRDIYDNDKVVMLTSDDLVDDLQSFASAFIRNANRSVIDYDLIVTQKNNKKIIDILSEVEQAIKKIKGCFVNGK